MVQRRLTKEVSMKSITIHGIDPALDKKIAEKSKEYGLSQNRTVKEILQKSLLGNRKAARRQAFANLFGVWSEEDQEEFEKHTREFEQADESD